MRRAGKMRAAAAAAALATLWLAAGCGGESERELLASARGYIGQQNHKAAIVQLKATLQKNPQSGEARFLLGQELLRTGELGPALLELGKAVDAGYDDHLAIPALARALLLAGEHRKITDTYGKLELGPPEAAADLKASVAAAWGAQGRADLAEAAMNEALRLDPAQPQARLLQARLAAGSGRFDEALAMVDAVLAGTPGLAEAHRLRGELLWLGKGDTEAAAGALRAAIAADPRSLRARSALVGVLLQRRDVEGFKAQVADMRKALPGHPQTRLYEAHLALLEGRTAAARELVQQLVKASPESPRVLQFAGAVELAGGSAVMAETHLRKALQLAPDLRVARRMLAQNELRMGHAERAIATLAPLLEHSPVPPEVLGIAAEAHLLAGNLPRAQALFAQAVKAAPDDARARTALALTQIAQGRGDAGFSELEGLAARDASAYADMALVSARLQRKEHDAALKAIAGLEAKQPGKPLAPYLRGKVLAERRDLAGARQGFEAAVAADGLFFPAVAALASMDVAQGRPADARARFEAMLARAPGHLRATIALADVKRREGAPQAEVLGLLEQAARLNPADSAPRRLVIEQMLEGSDRQAALGAARNAATAFPDDPQVLELLARAQLAVREPQQAVTTLRKVLALWPNSHGTYLRLAEAQAASGEPAGAAASLRKALELSPGLLAAQQGLLQLALADKRYDEALRIARGVQRDRPADAIGWSLETDTHSAQRDWNAAIVSARTALERQPLPALAMKLHALYLVAARQPEADALAAGWMRAHPRDMAFLSHLATVAMDRKDYARAEAAWRTVLEHRGDDVVAINNLSWLLLQQGRPGARPLAEKAHRLAPGQPAVMDTLAAALAADGEIVKAIEWQRRAVAQAPAVPDYRLNLARMLAQAGDKAAARTELEALRRLGTGFARQREVATLLEALS